MRIFALADIGNDVDFYLFNNASDTATSHAFKSSIGLYNRESALWVLPPQDNVYLLEVRFFSVNQLRDCNYFTFEVAVRSNATVRDEMLCPANLPNELQQVPLATYDLRNGADRSSFGDNYLFTRQRIDGNTHGGVFTYRIAIPAGPTAMVVSASIGYDFLATDFQLRISDNYGRQVAVGEADAAPTRDGDFNFMNSVAAVLVNGSYFLDITENVPQYGSGQYCQYFSFQFLAYKQSTAPRLITVNPASAYDLDPNTDLTLTVSFSDAVNMQVRFFTIMMT